LILPEDTPKAANTKQTKANTRKIKSRFIMPIPFDKYDYLKWGDLKRNPYSSYHNSQEWFEWHLNDDKRLLLIALERYADKITYWHKYFKK
jgi:hypothetical protein